MKITLFLSFTLCLFSSFTFARGQFVCDESYGMGVELGFNHHDLNYQPSIPLCFSSGTDYGQQIREQHSQEFKACQNAYWSGYQYGIKADVLVISELSDCTIAGYTYGTAQLTVSARARDAAVVGQPCVNAYQTGFAEGSQHMMNTSYSTNVESRCYQTGWSDGAN